MRISSIISYKLMAIIGIILSLAHFVEPTRYLLWGSIWIVVSIFTWMKRIWAVSLLTLFSIITFYKDIILEAPTLKESLYELTPGPNVERETVIVLGVALFTFEALILGYVILAGILAVKRDASMRR